MNNEVYHGKRFDIPADVWVELLKAIKEMKALSPQNTDKGGDAA